MVSSENCMAGDFKKSSTTLLDETDLLLASGWLVGAVLSTGAAGGVEAGSSAAGSSAAGSSAAGTGATGTTGGVGCCTGCGGHSFSGVGGGATGGEEGSGRGPVGNDAGSAFLSGDAITGGSGAVSTGYHEAGEDDGGASPWTSAAGFSGSRFSGSRFRVFGFPVSGFRTVGCVLRAARFFCGFCKPSASKSASRD